MWNSLLFCLMLVSLKLLIKGDFDLRSQDNKTQTIDLCTLQLEKGSCNKQLKRYYYNAESGMCLDFTYTGCTSNNNNFETYEECEKNCPGNFIQIRQPLHCFEEPEVGECSDPQPSFYYNWRNRKCMKFTYTGCYGNKNRFASYQKCYEECKSRQFIIKDA